MHFRDALCAGARALGVELTEAHVAAFVRYERLLDAWRSRINLTSLSDPHEVAVKHFVDSLAVLDALDQVTASTLVDIGTGAGFPGLVLKIVRPSLRVTLVDGQAKKLRFLNEVVAALGLQDVRLVHGRAEEMGRDDSWRDGFDIATARAVGRLAVVAEYTVPLLRVGGVAIALRGPNGVEECEQAKDAVALLGGEITSLRRLELPAGMGGRVIVTIRKTATTSNRYPRRPGVPAKRPLA